MSVLNQGPGPFPHLAEIARKYRAIADDLDRIARGRALNARRKEMGAHSGLQ